MINQNEEWEEKENTIQKKNNSKPKENDKCGIIGETRNDLKKKPENDIGGIKTKICRGGKIHCNKEKSIENFERGRNQCKDCRKKQANQPKIIKEIFEDGFKRCKGCKIEKPLSEFHKMKKGLFGVRTKCKECRKIERIEYSLRPEVKQRNKEYYQKNKHSMRKRLRVYYWTLTSQYHRYLKNAKKKGMDFELTKDDCINFYNTKCYYCGEEYRGLGIDRIDSSIGYKKNNIRPCCKICNSMKLNYTEGNFYNYIKKIVKNLNL